MLIFINKKLGRINEKLKTELDQAKSGSCSTSCQTPQYILSDDEFSNADDEQSYRPQKKLKTKPKTIIKSDEIRKQDVDAAWVCKYMHVITDNAFLSNLYRLFLTIERNERNIKNFIT